MRFKFGMLFDRRMRNENAEMMEPIQLGIRHEKFIHLLRELFTILIMLLPNTQTFNI